MSNVVNLHSELEIVYDITTQTKINSAKSNRIEYRIIVQGQEPLNEKKVFARLNIVVTKDGKFVKTYYG